MDPMDPVDPIVPHLERNRMIAVPAHDVAPLVEHWSRMRRLRDQVDESMLADAEIAITWAPEDRHG